MIKYENQLGCVEMSEGYFASLIGYAASECFGVAGMANTSATEGLLSAIRRKDRPDKGVRVRTTGGALLIDLHIEVTYGVNISAIVRSIINKVRYTVSDATGFEVAKVNVFVDGMKA